MRNNFPHHFAHRERFGIVAEEFDVFVDLEQAFHGLLVVCSFIAQLSIFHGILLVIDRRASKIFLVEFLNCLLEFVALGCRISGVVPSKAFDLAFPDFFAATFECTSSDLAKDLPLPFREEVVTIPELEQLFFKIYQEFLSIAVRECVDELLDLISFAVFEGGLDLVIISLGLFDVEDEFRLGVCRRLVRQLSAVAFRLPVPRDGFVRSNSRSLSLVTSK